jgi:flagellar L-ring protein precursor FlgH
MSKKMALLLVLTGVMLFPSVSLQAGSIWAKRDKDMPNLYADDVARNIGDILTIKISEDSRIDNKAKRDLQKETDRSSTFDGELGIVTPGHNLLPRIPGFSMAAETTNELKSKADYKDERKFVDSMTVVVEDILPNGHLVVMGTRHRDIGGDMQTIEVSGIVRTSDITFDNTVESKRVADFRIVTKHKGISAPYSRPGWLGRIFDILWPF